MKETRTYLTILRPIKSNMIREPKKEFLTQ
jgi:hypothetical protein